MTRDTWSFRLGPLGTEAEALAHQLAEVTDTKHTTTDYVRDAVTRHNRWARQVLAATEIPGGDIIVSGAEVIVAGQQLGPGVYRIKGTTNLITVGDGMPADDDI